METMRYTRVSRITSIILTQRVIFPSDSEVTVWTYSNRSLAYAKKDLYGMPSLRNWCKHSGWVMKAVELPKFESGWEPPIL